MSPQRIGENGWAPGPTSADVRCGASVALFRMTTPGTTEITGDLTTARAGTVILEARAYDGTLLTRRTVEDEMSLLRGTLGAFGGDTIFLITSRVRAYPVVDEFVLQPR